MQGEDKAHGRGGDGIMNTDLFRWGLWNEKADGHWIKHGAYESVVAAESRKESLIKDFNDQLSSHWEIRDEGTA